MLTEEQWEALAEWVRHEAARAVADDRPQHNRLPKESDDVSYAENAARSAFGLGWKE